MIKLPFFSSRESKNKKLGIDIGSTAVKILEPEKLSYSSAYLDKYSVFESDSYIKALTERGLDKARSRAELSSGFDRILLSLPPDAFQARTTSLTIERGKEGKINKKERKKLIGRAKKKIKKQVSLELGILPEDIYFKSWDLVEVKIDGYAVSELEGYNGRKVKIKLLSVFLLSKYLKLREMVEGKLEGEVELTHLAQGILKNIDLLQDGIYLDVGGEATQLFLIKNQRLKFTGQARVGGRVFSQALEKELGLTELRAKVLKERYSREELSEEVARGIRRMLREGRSYWLKAVKDLLKKQEVKSLPSTFYLFGGGSKLSDLQLVLSQDKWNDFAFLNSPEVKFLTPESMGFNIFDVQYTPLSLIVSDKNL